MKHLSQSTLLTLHRCWILCVCVCVCYYHLNFDLNCLLPILSTIVDGPGSNSSAVFLWRTKMLLHRGGFMSVGGVSGITLASGFYFGTKLCKTKITMKRNQTSFECAAFKEDHRKSRFSDYVEHLHNICRIITLMLCFFFIFILSFEINRVYTSLYNLVEDMLTKCSSVVQPPPPLHSHSHTYEILACNQWSKEVTVHSRCFMNS